MYFFCQLFLSYPIACNFFLTLPTCHQLLPSSFFYLLATYSYLPANFSYLLVIYLFLLLPTCCLLHNSHYFSINAQLLPSVNYSLIRPCFPQCASFTSSLLHTSLPSASLHPPSSLLPSFVSWLCVVPYWVSKRFTRITILIGI